MLKRVFVIILVLLTSITSFSQPHTRYRYEYIGGLGPNNFLGELGGADRIGTHFLRDFDFSATRFCLNGGLRYKDNPYYAFKGMFSFAMVSGNDAFTNEIYRHNRNLHFRSPIVELSVQGEFYFIREKSKNLYKISGLSTKKKRRATTAYVFSGVGVFFYAPQAKYNGKWENLRKLHTEGQGLTGGPKQYSNFNLCIPFGIGVKHAIDKRWSVGGELSVRKTFTDYIDDVSTRYYDKAKLTAAYGATAAALADPSLGEVKGASLPNADGSGAQRGNPKYKDAYMFLTVNIGYKFTRRGRTRAKF